MEKKKAVAVGVGLLLLGLGAAALAKKDDDEDDDDTDDDFDPNVINPVTPDGPTDPNIGPVFPAEPDPVLPPPNVKNYVGSGYDWPFRNTFPTETSIVNALFLLGYPMSFAPRTEGANPSGANIISGYNMKLVREFQRDYNAASGAQTVDTPAVPKTLDTDGLVGKNTLRGIINARRWVDVLNVSWVDIVELA